MGKKALADMTTIFDAVSAMTVVANKVLDKKFDNFYDMKNGFKEILEAEKHKKMKQSGINNDDVQEDDEESEDDKDSEDEEVDKVDKVDEVDGDDEDDKNDDDDNADG